MIQPSGDLSVRFAERSSAQIVWRSTRATSRESIGCFLRRNNAGPARFYFDSTTAGKFLMKYTIVSRSGDDDMLLQTGGFRYDGLP